MDKKKKIIENDMNTIHIYSHADGTLKDKDISRQKYLENKRYEFIRVRI